MSRFKLADLGPGLLLAAAGIGVGDMVSSIIAGAQYGMVLIWALLAGVLIKYTITEGAARWQLATDRTLMEGWRDHLPGPLLVGFFIYFVVWSNLVASALVSARALVPAAVFPSVSVRTWGTLHAVVAFAMVYFGRYEQFLAVVKWFIAFKVVAVIATVLLIIVRSGADWSALGSRSDLEVGYVLSLIGGIGGTVTLLSYGYWMREEGWSGPRRLGTARIDLLFSFGLAFVFALAMMFLSTQITWEGAILDEGPRLCLLLADRIALETGPIGRAVFLVGFWGAAFSAVLGVWHGVPFLFDDFVHLWRRSPAGGQQGSPYRSWAAYLTLASISALLFGRPVRLVFAYTIVGSLFFPFVIFTLLYLNNTKKLGTLRSGVAVNAVLGGALVLFGYLAVMSIRG
jgi:Mn2+/Fe2+ NRAMP family transporter